MGRHGNVSKSAGPHRCPPHGDGLRSLFEKPRGHFMTGRKSGAGIVASTVAVNLKDCAPFGSAHRQGLIAAEKSKWEQLYQNGVATQSAGKTEAAVGWFHEAAQIDDQFADLRFRQGG